MSYRLPAEWEPQSGILIAWPHAETDWAESLAEVEAVYLQIVTAVSRFEVCVIATPQPETLRQKLEQNNLPLERIRLYPIPTDDTWSRDFGPITIIDEDQPLLLDFGFNGWGLKFACAHDNQATRRLHAAGAFAETELRSVGLILEGGSIESDGEGLLLTTSECLLNQNRNPHLDRTDIEQQLQRLLGCDRLLWLDHGHLLGDDTDAHIDTLARLCPDNTIVYQGCDDPDDAHFDALGAMRDQLQSFRTRDDEPFRLLPLPWPQARYDDEERLPATYANFLVINGAVLVPTYDDPGDAEALATIADAFPDREVIGIDCLPLIRQHGSLHCVTMQIPEGVPL